MTELLYLYDHYLKEFDAKVLSSDGKSIILDRTAIYPRGGGQPSDKGVLTFDHLARLEVVDSQKESGSVVHFLASLQTKDVSDSFIGRTVHGSIDWPLRYSHMRHHTALHILSGVVYHEFNSKITGGQIYPERARLDFTLADLNKPRLDLIETAMNRVVEEDHEVRSLWIDSEEAAKHAELYRLSADLLPKGLDKLRIVEIVGFDSQLDGGTHVARTGEVGKIRISKTENKGKDNKRIEIVLS